MFDFSHPLRATSGSGVEAEAVEQRERVAESVLLGDGAGGADELGGAIAVAGPVVLEEDARQVVLGSGDPTRRSRVARSRRGPVRDAPRRRRAVRRCGRGCRGCDGPSPSESIPAADDDVSGRPRREPFGERAVGGVVVDRVADVGELRDGDRLRCRRWGSSRSRRRGAVGRGCGLRRSRRVGGRWRASAMRRPGMPGFLLDGVANEVDDLAGAGLFVAQPDQLRAVDGERGGVGQVASATSTSSSAVSAAASSPRMRSRPARNIAAAPQLARDA